MQFIFEDMSFLNISININCADIDCIKLIIVSQIHNSRICHLYFFVDTLLNFFLYIFFCNPLYWIFTKIVHNSSRILFRGIEELLNRFPFCFLFQNKIETDIYVFLYNNTIRYFIYKIGSTLLICNNSIHDDIYYDEYNICFFAVRAPRTTLFQ